MSEWKEYRLGDICEVFGRIGFRGYTSKDLVETYEDGAISLSPSNIVQGEIELSKCTYIKWDKYEESPEIKIQVGDIIFVKTGSSYGRSALIRSVEHPMTLNPQLVVLKNIKVNPIILSYVIKGREFQGKVYGIIGGSAIPTLSQKRLAELTIKLPSKERQDRISDILLSIDSKISVNRRICENLEAQAQALFKHWFIDFAPFKDGKFVESELGMIPEGWRVGKAEDFYSINIGKTPPRAQQQWFSESKNNNKIWISISDMGNCGAFISDSKEYLTPEAQNKFNIIMVPIGTILLSFKLTIGRVAIANEELTTNEAIARFILPSTEYREFTYLYLKQYKYGRLGSTSSIATAVNSKIIKSMLLLMPTTDVIKGFSSITSKLFDEIKTLTQESSRLSTLRDTLLPRLMSGQIKL